MKCVTSEGKCERSHTCLSESCALTVVMSCPSGCVSMMGTVMRSLIQWGQLRLRLTCTFTVTTLALAGWPLSLARTRIYKDSHTTDTDHTRPRRLAVVTRSHTDLQGQSNYRHRPTSIAHPWGHRPPSTHQHP